MWSYIGTNASRAARFQHAARPAACTVLLAVAPARALIPVAASDAGFVTLMGGSAKGDGTLAPGATYNYSVGFELHYATGALSPPPFAPMPRRNCFVFDLSSITVPIVGATLKLWTGIYESVHPTELYVLHGPGDMATALSLATDLAGGIVPADFDEPDDALVMKAADLFGLLGAGPMVAPPFEISSALDGSFIDIVIGSAGAAYLSSFIGGKVLLSGFVPTIDGMPPMSPQQPFGFTGPDIPGLDPLTPMLVLTLVAEPPSALLLLARSRSQSRS